MFFPNSAKNEICALFGDEIKFGLSTLKKPLPKKARLNQWRF